MPEAALKIQSTATLSAFDWSLPPSQLQPWLRKQTCRQPLTGMTAQQCGIWLNFLGSVTKLTVATETCDLFHTRQALEPKASVSRAERFGPARLSPITTVSCAPRNHHLILILCPVWGSPTSTQQPFKTRFRTQWLCRCQGEARISDNTEEDSSAAECSSTHHLLLSSYLWASRLKASSFVVSACALDSTSTE